MRRRRGLLTVFTVFAVFSTVLTVGGPVRPAAAETSVVLDGRAQWHGWGMSQYGAYGYAVDHGWTAAQILDHYYGGTVAGSVPTASTVAVRLRGLDGQQTAVVSPTGKVRVDGIGGGPYTSVVARWNGTTYTVWGRTDAEVCPYSTTDLAATGWTQLSASVAAPVIMRAALANSSTTTNYGDLLAACHPTGEVRSYRGAILASEAGLRTINVVKMEDYLRSVVASEMIPSWGTAGGGRGAQALQAQAVAARSYATTDHREVYAPEIPGTLAETCDTTACQAYPGAARRTSLSAPFTRVEYPTTDAAVLATAGVVRRIGSTSGPVARTYFSASNGGATSPGPDVLSPFPAVIDRGDATASNPYKDFTWSTTLTGTSIAAKYPAIGTFRELVVVRRTCVGDAYGGRVVELELRGSAGAVRVSGDLFTTAMGLKSNWFAVRGAAPFGGCSCPAPVVTGAAPPVVASRFVASTSPQRLVDTRTGQGAPTLLGAGCTLVVDPGLDAGATAVVLNVTAIRPAARGFITAYPCGVTRPGVAALQAVPGRAVAGSVVTPLGTDGTVCIFSSAATHLTVDIFGTYSSIGVASAGARFQPIVPARAYASWNNGAPPLGAGSTTTAAVAGRNGVPTGATAVAVTVHSTGATADGFATVYPCGATRPGVSTVNVSAGASVTNQLQVALGAGGALCIYTSTPMHVLIDVAGWFGSGATTDFYAVTPVRVLDTRVGTGLTGAFTDLSSPRSVAVASVSGLPAAGSVAAFLASVTAVQPATTGYVSVYPTCPVGPPALSMVRYTATANAATMVLGIDDSAGRWCIVTSSQVHLTADVNGYYA